MSEKFRIVQVGMGHDHAPGAMGTFRDMPEVFEVLGIIEEDEKILEYWQHNPTFEGVKHLTWDEAFAMKPDAFVIETEDLKLVENAIRALEAGYNVQMDKPGSEDCESFHYMCELAEKKGLVLHLGYMYRYNPAIKHAMELKNSGKLGEIFSVEAQMSVRHQNDKRSWLKQFKGGMMYFLGCHLVDLVVQFCGFPEEVIPFNTNTGIDGNDSLDLGFAVFRYKNGVSFVKTCATELNGHDRRQCVINGSLGTIEIKPLEINRPEGKIEVEARETLNNDDAWNDNSTPLRYPYFKRYDEMLLSFVDYCRGVKKNPYTPEYEARLHDVIMKACGR